MHHLRLLSIVLLCTLSLVGRSTSSPGTRTAYLGPLDRAAGGQAATASPPPQWGERLAGLQLGTRSEASLANAGRSRRELWLPPPAEIPTFEPPPAGEEPVPAPLAHKPHFLGQSDDDILSRICNLPIKQLKPLGGGRRSRCAPSSTGACRPRSSRIRCASRAINRKSLPIASRGPWAWIWCRPPVCGAFPPSS